MQETIGWIKVNIKGDRIYSRNNRIDGRSNWKNRIGCRNNRIDGKNDRIDERN